MANAIDRSIAIAAQKKGIAGPGLGWHGDVATHDSQGGFTGISNVQPIQQTTKTDGGGGGGGGGQSHEQQYGEPLGGAADIYNADGHFSSQEDYDRWKSRESAIRGTLETGFSQNLSNLQGLLPQYAQRQEKDEGYITDAYGNIVSGLQQGADIARQKISGFRDDVTERGRYASSEVAQNLRNMLKATSVQLGAYGAGDTSASNIMAPYAFAKLATRGQGDVNRQVMSQQGDLDQKELDVHQTFTQQKNEAEQWKTTNLMQVRDKYLPIIQRIRDQIANAPLQRAEALANMEMSFLQRAQDEASRIEADARAFAQNAAITAQTQLGQLTQLKLQIQNSGNFSPQDVVAQSFGGGVMGGTPQGVGANAVPYYRRDEKTA